MKVLFIDLSGTIYTYHGNKEIVEKKIKTLGYICQILGTKVILSSALKEEIDEKTMETDIEELKQLFLLFEKYGIDCIGRTPTVKRKIHGNSCLPIPWKEDEIRLCLYYNPDIEAFCVLDDYDTKNWKKSDLEKVKDHLVTMQFYSENENEEGIQESHMEEIKKVLTKENKYRYWRKDGPKKIR